MGLHMEMINLKTVTCFSHKEVDLETKSEGT